MHAMDLLSTDLAVRLDELGDGDQRGRQTWHEVHTWEVDVDATHANAPTPNARGNKLPADAAHAEVALANEATQEGRVTCQVPTCTGVSNTADALIFSFAIGGEEGHCAHLGWLMRPRQRLLLYHLSPPRHRSGARA